MPLEATLDFDGAFAANASGATIIGASATPLADSDDATYIQSDANGVIVNYTVGIAPLAPGAFEVESLELTITLSLSGGNTGAGGLGDRDIYLFLQPTSGTSGEVGQFTTGAFGDPASMPGGYAYTGTPVDLTLSYVPADGFTVDDAVVALEAGAFFRVNTLWNDSDDVNALGKIYQASLAVHSPGVPSMLVEDFEGGTDGAVITRTNTDLEGIDQFAPPHADNPDLIFTSAVQHSGALSMTAKITGGGYGFGTVQYPMVGNVPSGAGFDDTFWVRYVGGAGYSHTFWDAVFGTPGTPKEEASNSRISVYLDSGTPTLYVNQITGADVEQTFTLPEGEWHKVEVTYDGASSLAVKITGEDDTVHLDYADAALTLVGEFSHWSDHSWGFSREGTFQNWLDDINVDSGPIFTLFMGGDQIPALYVGSLGVDNLKAGAN